MPVAIVTGTDSGIGRATAVALGRKGYDGGITRHEDDAGAEQTADEVRATGRRAEVRRLDRSNATNGPPVLDELAAALGRLDVLLNNAATGDSTPCSRSTSPPAAAWAWSRSSWRSSSRSTGSRSTRWHQARSRRR